MTCLRETLRQYYPFPPGPCSGKQETYSRFYSRVLSTSKSKGGLMGGGGGGQRVQLHRLRPALARSNLRSTLGSVWQQHNPTVPTTQPQWPHKRVPVSPAPDPEQWSRSPSTSIISPSTQRGTMRPIGWSGIRKSYAVDTDCPRPRHLNAGLSPVTTRLCSSWTPPPHLRLPQKTLPCPFNPKPSSSQPYL